MQAENQHWRDNLLEDPVAIRNLLESVRRIAVLGIKPDDQSLQPAFYVPQYMKSMGYEIVPVPVYFPKITHILGIPVIRSLRDVPGPVDLLNVFRRSDDIPQHVEDILALKPTAVWMQSGIRNAEAAEQFARAGIQVVQDHCLMVEHRHLIASRR